VIGVWWNTWGGGSTQACFLENRKGGVDSERDKLKREGKIRKSKKASEMCGDRTSDQSGHCLRIAERNVEQGLEKNFKG